jgi:hypothetical protein
MKNLTAGAMLIMTFLGVGAAQPGQPPARPKSQPQTPADQHPSVKHPVVPQAPATWPKARAADVESLDATIKSFYLLSSGGPGEARDWDRYRSLFLPESRLIAARPTETGAGAVVLTVTDFVAQNSKYLERGGFFDREIGRRVETFGNMAQVWSTYESRHEPDGVPYVRGINSIQLLKDGDRWWIVNVFWDFERADTPIPDEYLKGAAAREPRP